LAGDLNAIHSTVPNSAGEVLLYELFDASDFKLSAPEHPTHHYLAGNGDVLDILVRQNI
jgi:hypothetical protein